MRIAPLKNLPLDRFGTGQSAARKKSFAVSWRESQGHCFWSARVSNFLRAGVKIPPKESPHRRIHETESDLCHPQLHKHGSHVLEGSWPDDFLCAGVIHCRTEGIEIGCLVMSENCLQLTRFACTQPRSIIFSTYTYMITWARTFSQLYAGPCYWQVRHTFDSDHIIYDHKRIPNDRHQYQSPTGYLVVWGPLLWNPRCARDCCQGDPKPTIQV